MTDDDYVTIPSTFGSAADKIVQIAKRALYIKDKCDSPIEIMLGAHLLATFPQIGFAKWQRNARPEGFTLVPQYSLDRFRYDFVLLWKLSPVLLIECDGKQFHSTKAQLANDKLKNELAARFNIPLVRFTGRQIYREIDLCIERIVSALQGAA